jgi:uncharacterized protein (TIGR00297 family)
MIARLALGVVGAALVAAGAWRVGALSRSGAIAATLVGAVATAAGCNWAALLIVFFVAGTALSRVGAAAKAARTNGVVEKTGARDARQVLANGGVFAVGAAAFARSGDPVWAAVALGALVGAFGDTVATEVGTLAGGTPRSILDGRPLAVGMSGGITATGTLAALIAAVGLAALGLWLAVDVRVATAALAGGVVGVFADSVLGALLQVRRWCPACAVRTERLVHGCGSRTRVSGGLAWLDNDGVNAAATLTSGLVAALVVAALGTR